jgi:surface-anchored protein
MAKALRALIWLALGCSSAERGAPSAMSGAAGQFGDLAGASGDEGGAGLGGDGASPFAGKTGAACGGDGIGTDVGEAGASPSGEGGAAAGGAPSRSRCDSDCELCYQEGHGDVFVDYAPETGLRVMLRTELEPGQGERLYLPDAVCILVGYQRYRLVAEAGGRPAGSTWDPLGVPEGTVFWQLPAIATAETPWFGTAVATLPAEQIRAPRVVLELAELAPDAGAFSAYTTTAFGTPTFLLSTASGLNEARLQSGSHAHMNWTFAEPGRVELTFVASAELLDGTRITSEEATFRFLIEPR